MFQFQGLDDSEEVREEDGENAWTFRWCHWRNCNNHLVILY